MQEQLETTTKQQQQTKNSWVGAQVVEALTVDER
jgi:hypothetical protein